MPTWPAKTNYATGDVLTAAQMQDIGNALNSVQSAQYAAGKNKIINGDFNIWQRGTSFNTQSVYTADRWFMVIGASGAATVSQQAFTPGTAPVAGYESQYFIRYSSANAVDARLLQPIEDVRTFAGQTVTVSFWAKSATSDALSNVSFRQGFGTGGSANVDTTSGSFTLTSSWARYSATLSIPSISGKTIGANNNLRLTFDLKDSATYDFDLWGVQVESGNTATAFQTATGTLAGELAACQRYFYKKSADSSNAYAYFAQGTITSATRIRCLVEFPTAMRSSPTITRAGNMKVGTAGQAVTASSIDMNTANGDGSGTKVAQAVMFDVASGLTTGQSGYVYADNDTTASLSFSAEL